MIDVKNRLPTKPNRWKITHESDSSEEYITWAYADEPTEAGTPINRKLYSDIYNNDIAPIGKINFYGERDDVTRAEEGFLYCNGSLITTIDYPDLEGMGNKQVAVDTGSNFNYEFAGYDYSTSIEKLYFYKKTDMLVEIYETTDLETFTKISQYTLQYGYNVQVEYRNGAIIIIERSALNNNSRYFAISINRTNYAKFNRTIYAGSECYYEYYNKMLMFSFRQNSSTSYNYRYDISNDSTTATATSLSVPNLIVHSVAYDIQNGIWIWSGQQRDATKAEICTSSDNGGTVSDEKFSSSTPSFMQIYYNAYLNKIYYEYTSSSTGYVGEITNIADVANSMVEKYSSSAISGGTGVQLFLEAKYPSIYNYKNNADVIVCDFILTYTFEVINAKTMFAFGDNTYIVRNSDNKLYRIDCVNLQGYTLPNTTGIGTRCYGYMKVEVIY